MQCEKRIRKMFALVTAAALLLGNMTPVSAMEAVETEPVVLETTCQETVIATEETGETAAETTASTEETVVATEETQVLETTEAVETIPEESTEAVTLPAETIPEETVQEETIPVTEETVPITEETVPETETMPMLLAAESPAEAQAFTRFGSQDAPMEATAANSVTSLGSGSGIKFRIFNYTNGKDASGNYITSGGINDNGLSGYFDFRGTSYENTAADGSQVSNFTNTVTDIDGYTANHATVLAQLGSDGYPVFDGSRDGGPQKSLGYLFGAGGKGVTAYAPSNTLLRLNSRGQYYYNSAANAVDFDTGSNRFIVRTYRERGQTTANHGAGQYYDFFPFTYWNGSTKENASSAHWYNYNNTQEVDYWFGMTMEAAFSMPAGGLVQQENMVFEFSGDDDVWVFIDDVLVLDLGGTHGVVSGSINFATGEVKQYLDWGGAGESSAGTSYPTTLKARFAAAGREPNGGWSGNIFADYTEHTIKFYYLERATSCANCKILFNMPILPTGKLTVEKEVEGIQTQLTAAEEYTFILEQIRDSGESAAAGVRFDRIDVKTGAVLETGTTGEDGSFRLKAGHRAEFDLTAGKIYRIRETDPGQYAVSAGCRVNGVSQPMPTETESITIDPEAPATVVFTNRLKTTSFAVGKKVAGNMGDRDQLFDFRARLYTAEPGTAGSFTAFPVPEAGEAYNVTDGEARFRLKHDVVMTFDDIPVGAWVVVTEELAQEYETVYRIGENTREGRIVQVGPVTGFVQVIYTNTREVLIDTGIRLDTVPYLLMSAAGGLPLLRRRKKEEP